ncbi:MAG: FkbM family methyltransferase [Desulfobacterales bacterium]
MPVKTWRKTARRRLNLKKPVASFAQEGEDRILRRIFEKQRNGFYVDVGAHHPFRFSNTAIFYNRGWHGINIDPLPNTINLFNRHRPRDINLEVGVADKADELTYFMFEEPALNTCNKAVAEERKINGISNMIGSITVPILPLSNILDRYLEINRMIDFMTIDAEGMDFEVLKSNNWEKYTPRIVVMESLDCDTINDVLASPPVRYLNRYGYEVIAKTLLSVFLEKRI